MLQHVDWREDCLVITLAKHKGDQSGEGLSNEKHIYANPLNPSICPILALAVLIFCTHRGQSTRLQQLYNGKNSEQRFGKILKVILNLIDSQLITLGANVGDIGTHSNRKGAASFVLNLSSTISPVNVYLRAGWSLGNVQDRYIFAGAGGDQLMGRAVSGLPINSKDFAILPPHFSDVDIEFIKNYGWDNVLEGYQYYPKSFQRVIPYLLASLIHHIGWLRSELGHCHPLWNQRLFSAVCDSGTGRDLLINHISEKVLLGWRFCSISNMHATGIPLDLLIATEVNELKEVVRKLEERSYRSISDSKTEILSKLEWLADALPTKIKDNIMENFIVDNVAPVNMADVTRAIETSHNHVVETLKELLASRFSSSPSQQNVSEGNQQSEQTDKSFQSWNWGGRLFCYVPEYFVFPTTDVKTMWNLWHYGNLSERIRPYKLLNTDGHRADLKEKKQKVNLYRANVVMSKLLQIAVNLNLLGENDSIESLPRERADEIYYKSYDMMIMELYDEHPLRMNEINYNTIANRLCKQINS
jgi:hypothetical protein